jgi:hypothetical protein
MSVLTVFCAVDDGLISFPPHWRATQGAAGKQRQRAGEVWPSEIMTILIHFHQRSEFPHLVSSSRFGALIPQLMIPLRASVQSR